jgi:hypothetical protein
MKFERSEQNGMLWNVAAKPPSINFDVVEKFKENLTSLFILVLKSFMGHDS